MHKVIKWIWMPSVHATLRESFSQRDHFLIVQSVGEGGKDWKMNSSHHQVLLVERGLSGWLRAKVKMTMQTLLTSDHTNTTTCGVCQTMQANIALQHTMNELIENHSDSYQIAFIFWSGGSGHFMQWELCSREIRRELLQRAQFMNAVNIRGMQHLVTSSCFSSWMLSESDYDKTRERKRERRARREREIVLMWTVLTVGQCHPPSEIISSQNCNQSCRNTSATILTQRLLGGNFLSLWFLPTHPFFYSVVQNCPVNVLNIDV